METETKPRPLYVRICTECDRAFDMTDPDDAEEWAYGHDCEVS